jgi:hypothetical protein
VNILVKGTIQGTVSDANGKFSLEVDGENTILVFSYIGYLSEEVSVNGKSLIDMKLVQDIKELEEVVVVGYGIQKIADITGSVSLVTTKTLKNCCFDPMQALQGKSRRC